MYPAALSIRAHVTHSGDVVGGHNSKLLLPDSVCRLQQTHTQDGSPAHYMWWFFKCMNTGPRLFGCLTCGVDCFAIFLCNCLGAEDALHGQQSHHLQAKGRKPLQQRHHHGRRQDQVDVVCSHVTVRSLHGRHTSG